MGGGGGDEGGGVEVVALPQQALPVRRQHLPIFILQIIYIYIYIARLKLIAAGRAAGPDPGAVGTTRSPVAGSHRSEGRGSERRDRNRGNRRNKAQ